MSYKEIAEVAAIRSHVMSRWRARASAARAWHADAPRRRTMSVTGVEQVHAYLDDELEPSSSNGSTCICAAAALERGL